MRVYRLTDDFPKDRKRVVALGLFDGVHTGHRLLISEATKIAKENNCPLSVFTFFSEDKLPKGQDRLYTTEEKLEILESLSVEEVFLAHFFDVADLLAEDFVSDVIINSLSAVCAVSGEDFRFGKGARGNVALLREIMQERGLHSLTVKDKTYDGHKVSTSDIKALLEIGRVREANNLLGSPYFISARVLHGDGRGRGLGLPTVNTECVGFSKNLPRGVYKSSVSIDGRDYSAITNIGICPTFSERDVHTETYILDYDGDLYGKEIKISFLDYVREEKKFESKEDLLSQIKTDLERIK